MPKLNRPYRKRRFLRTIMLRLDAFFDSVVWATASHLGRIGESVAERSRRLRPRGWKRIFIELLGESMTLGAAGSVLLLLLSIPAVEATRGDWRNRGDFAVTFLDRYGNVIGHRGIIHQNSLPFEALPDHLIKAVLATEDRRFFDHFGIDVMGLIRAMTVNAQAGEVVQGGSTLTQQLAKNLFLSNERSLQRKITEAFLSFWLEANLSKKEILSFYLDRAYMGGGTFGIAAASQFYFGKNVADLDLAEAAMLAGLFKAPAKYAPHVNLPAARARAHEVLINLVQSGFMNEGEIMQALRHPASVIDREETEAPDFFLDWAFDEVKQLAAQFPQHSLIVRTTIDLNLQKVADSSVEAMLREYGESYRVKQGALVMIENGGAVRAMVGGRDYGESQFNRATKALRQPGSSFKPYTYAVAMEQGMTPQTVVVDGPVVWGNWSPKNYGNSYSGRVTLLTAIAKSINTVPVRLAKEKLGLDPIIAMAKAMGVETPVRRDATIPLGTSELTVMDQATGYAVFPTGGLQARRHGVSQILDYKGEVLYDFDRDAPKPARVLSEKAAFSMNAMLTQIPVIGTARKAALDQGIVTGGKTGTTQAYRDAWFVGFTGNFTCAVWFGNDDYTSSNNMTGGSLPAMTFKRVMDYAHQGIGLKAIPGFPASIAPQTSPAIAQASDSDQPSIAAAEPQRFMSPQSLKILQDIGKDLSRETVVDVRSIVTPP